MLQRASFSVLCAAVIGKMDVVGKMKVGEQRKRCIAAKAFPFFPI